MSNRECDGMASFMAGQRAAFGGRPLFGLFTLLASPAWPAAQRPNASPNIVLIFCDDLGMATSGALARAPSDAEHRPSGVRAFGSPIFTSPNPSVPHRARRFLTGVT
jgi:hypothetical protein